jgi:Mg-chelatase subunit ChlD
MTGQPLEMALEAAGAAIDKLTKDDCAGVIAFDSQPTRVVELASVAPASMHIAIEKIRAGGGTAIFSAIDLAHQELVRARHAKHRHAILLTDGQAPRHGIRDLVDAMAAEGITVSAIGLGSGVDAALLRMIAERGGGREREVNDPARLPGIFRAEIDAAKK